MQINGRMTISDFGIIYLSLCAPFLVYFYHQIRRRTEISAYFRALARAAAWPIFGSRVIYAEIRSAYLSAKFEDHDDATGTSSAAEIFAAEIEAALMAAGLRREARRARFLIEQDAALSNGNGHGKTNGGFEGELFKLVGHGNEKLAAICLRRRNLAKLALHQKKARLELLEFIRPFWESNIIGGDLRQRILELMKIPDAAKETTPHPLPETPITANAASARRWTRRNFRWRQDVNIQASAKKQPVSEIQMQ